MKLGKNKKPGKKIKELNKSIMAAGYSVKSVKTNLLKVLLEKVIPTFQESKKKNAFFGIYF